jgi:hypothetical protein
MKYSKIEIKTPDDHEAHQNFPSQGLAKYIKIGIFGLKCIYHLAALILG